MFQTAVKMWALSLRLWKKKREENLLESFVFLFYFFPSRIGEGKKKLIQKEEEKKEKYLYVLIIGQWAKQMAHLKSTFFRQSLLLFTVII